MDGGGGGDGSTEGQVSAEEVPKEKRLRYRCGLLSFFGRREVDHGDHAVETPHESGFTDLCFTCNERNDTFGGCSHMSFGPFQNPTPWFVSSCAACSTGY